MVTGVWANPNYDGEEGTRNRILKQVDEWYREAAEALYAPKSKKIDKDNPFFGAMKLPDDPGMPDIPPDDPRRILDVPDVDQPLEGGD